MRVYINRTTDEYVILKMISEYFELTNNSLLVKDELPVHDTYRVAEVFHSSGTISVIEELEFHTKYSYSETVEDFSSLLKKGSEK